MTDILQINDNLRVRDADINQYVVEYRTESQKTPGEFVWHAHRWCGSPASVLQSVSGYLANEAANAARDKALSEFVISEFCDLIMALPKKTGKGKS